MADVTLPRTLTPGTVENVTHVQENDQALADIINGAMPAYSTWKPFGTTASAYQISALTTTNLLLGDSSNPPAQVGASAAYAGAFVRSLPSGVTAGTRTTQCRMVVYTAVNGTAVGTDIQVRLYPVTALAGGASAVPYISTIGTLVTGSTVTVATASLGSLWRIPTIGTAFTMPSTSPTSDYVVALSTVSGTQAGTSVLGIRVDMEYKQT